MACVHAQRTAGNSGLARAAKSKPSTPVPMGDGPGAEELRASKAAQPQGNQHLLLKKSRVQQLLRVIDRALLTTACQALLQHKHHPMQGVEHAWIVRLGAGAGRRRRDKKHETPTTDPPPAPARPGHAKHDPWLGGGGSGVSRAPRSRGLAKATHPRRGRGGKRKKLKLRSIGPGPGAAGVGLSPAADAHPASSRAAEVLA
jgi:hypothetical protein